jgi:hypothetical protein
MALRGGENFNAYTPAPVTLPTVALADVDLEREAREAAQRIAERRVVAASTHGGRLTKPKVLTAGKRSGPPWQSGNATRSRSHKQTRRGGEIISREFGTWMKRHGFDAMAKSVRSVAIELHENTKAIEAWRATLPDRQRRRLIHPLSNVRRWRASLNPGNGKCPTDLRRDAVAAWKRFVSCVEFLPPDRAAPLWQAAHTQAAAWCGMAQHTEMQI